jgi:uncharacterized damage-inducible protein DinB
MLDKQGRERRYDLAPLEGFGSKDVGFAAAILDELRERVYDQVVDLPAEAMNFYTGATRLSIGRLMLHLAWAEASWMRRLSRRELPEDLNHRLGAGSLQLFGEEPTRVGEPSELIAVCRRVRDEATLPYLKGVQNIDEVRMDDGTTIRGVLMHLTWHWIYHSGHIGLVRLEWGSDYTWTIRRPLRLPE